MSPEADLSELNRRELEAESEGSAEEAGREVGPAEELLLERIHQLEDALVWCSGSNDFQEGGTARVGFLELVQPLLKTLASGKPVTTASDAGTESTDYGELLNDLFTYHKPDEEQIPLYAAVREKAREMAQVIHDSCPPSADRTTAMRQLQDTVMTANRAIALDGRSYR